MKHKRRVQFGIAGLLLLMTIIAGYFFGYNQGGRAKFLATMSTATYAADGLLTPNLPVVNQLEDIELLIKQSILPDSWIERGGMASITLYDSNASIVVYQTGSGHERIESLFESLYDLRRETMNERSFDVTYNLDDVIDVTTEKAPERQLTSICRLAGKAHKSYVFGEEPVFSPQPEMLSVVVTARESMHEKLRTYFERLRFSRESISEIDGM